MILEKFVKPLSKKNLLGLRLHTRPLTQTENSFVQCVFGREFKRFQRFFLKSSARSDTFVGKGSEN